MPFAISLSARGSHFALSLAVLFSSILCACAPSYSPIPLFSIEDGKPLPIYREVQAGEELWISLKDGSQIQGKFVSSRNDSIYLTVVRTSDSSRGWAIGDSIAVHHYAISDISLKGETGLSSFAMGSLASIVLLVVLIL